MEELHVIINLLQHRVCNCHGATACKVNAALLHKVNNSILYNLSVHFECRNVRVVTKILHNSVSYITHARLNWKE